MRTDTRQAAASRWAPRMLQLFCMLISSQGRTRRHGKPGSVLAVTSRRCCRGWRLPPALSPPLEFGSVPLSPAKQAARERSSTPCCTQTFAPHPTPPPLAYSTESGCFQVGSLLFIYTPPLVAKHDNSKVAYNIKTYYAQLKYCLKPFIIKIPTYKKVKGKNS